MILSKLLVNHLQFMSAQSTVKAGWAMFGIGAFTALAGGASYTLHLKYYDLSWEMRDALRDEYNWSIDRPGFEPDERAKYLSNAYNFYDEKHEFCEDLGIGLLSAGGGMMVVSIPILSAGYGMKNNIHKYYNKTPNSHPVFTLNLQSSKNGIGLAFNF